MAITIQKHHDRALFLQMHVGEATYGSGEGMLKIQLGNVTPSGDLIALVSREGKKGLTTYTLPMRAFVEQVIAAEQGLVEFIFVDKDGVKAKERTEEEIIDEVRKGRT